MDAVQAFPQGGSAIFVAPVAVVSQTRGNNLASVTIVVTASADSQTVSIGSNDYPLGSDASNTVSIAGVTFDVDYTASTKTFVISADAIPSAFEDAVRSIQYVNAAGSVTEGDVVFSVTVSDGTNTATADATVTVYVPAVVDANGAGGNRTATFTEGGSAVALVAGNVSDDLLDGRHVW